MIVTVTVWGKLYWTGQEISQRLRSSREQMVPSSLPLIFCHLRGSISLHISLHFSPFLSTFLSISLHFSPHFSPPSRPSHFPTRNYLSSVHYKLPPVFVLLYNALQLGSLQGPTASHKIPSEGHVQEYRAFWQYNKGFLVVFSDTSTHRKLT